MARLGSLALVLVALSIAGTSRAAELDQDAERLLSAVKLSRSSRNNLIDLSPENFRTLLEGPSRPYSVVILGDAKHMRSNSKMRLDQVISEVEMAAKAHGRALEDRVAEWQRARADRARGAASGAGDAPPPPPLPRAVFFAKIEFSRDRDLFMRLGVQSLPWMACVGSDVAVRAAGGSPIAIGARAGKPTDDYPWAAQTVADWASEKAGGPAPGGGGGADGGASAPAIPRVEVPKPLSSVLIPAAIGLGLLGGLVYILARFPLYSYPTLYLVASLAVLWWSFSGGMYVIIRKMPTVYHDPRLRKTIAFLPGQGQLGAEGYIMGSAYLSCGLSLVTLVSLVPRVEDPRNRRVAGYLCLALGCLALRIVTANHGWKTSLHPKWY